MKSLDAVRKEWASTIDGLEPSVTLRRADGQVSDAIAVIASNADIVVRFERDRQTAVRAQREAAQKAARTKAEQDAQAKAARVAQRTRMRELFRGAVK